MDVRRTALVVAGASSATLIVVIVLVLTHPESRRPANNAPNATFQSAPGLYMGIDDPAIVNGTASGLPYVYLELLVSEPVDQYSTISTSSAQVVDQHWSFQLPNRVAAALGTYRLCVYSSPNMTGLLDCHDFMIEPAIQITSLASTSLVGKVTISNDRLSAVDIAIYRTSAAGIGAPLLASSNNPVSAEWSIPIDPPLKSGAYVVYIYRSGAHGIPLQVSGFVIQN